MATKKERQEQEALARSNVRQITDEDVFRLDAITKSIQKQLQLKNEYNRAAKEEVNIQKQLRELGRKAVIDANKYSRVTGEIKQLEKELAEAKEKAITDNSQAVKDVIKFTEASLLAEKRKQKELGRTRGGSLRAIEEEARKRKEALATERRLIRDINKERGLGGKITDLFRSKEERQRQVDIARARAGGGVQTIASGSGGAGGGTGGAAGTASAAGGAGGGKGGWLALIAGTGIVGAVIAALVTKIAKLGPAVAALGSVLKSNITAPLTQASNLVGGGIGGGMGVGGGAISGAGATSILGGFQDIISKIPIVGGLLGGVVGIFKGIVDLVLGIDQGITNFARNVGISKEQAKGIKEQFREIAKTSDNIVINETRLMESQTELTKALGIRSIFSRDILENNVKLKEVAGIELDTRKALVESSVIQGRNATALTKSILAQSKALEFQTGVAFEYRQVLGEATKQAGVLGLNFTRYPEKLTRALMTVKTMGYELKQLDSIASSFLDFESSISKEFEAQVLTGKEMNLTKAREAALNNDLVTLAKEINVNVGSTADYLKLNRIQQDAIAESVGMTRDGLADVLKQQDYYAKLGATNLKQAQEELKILKQKGLTQAEISKKIGEDAYNYITQTATAEKLTELMNRIKTIFIEFVEKSGILDFITNPQKIQGFVQGLMDRFAGAVEFVGRLVASLVEAVATIVGAFGGDEKGLRRLAGSIRSGAGEFGTGLRAAGETVGAMTIGDNVVRNNASTVSAAPAASTAAAAPEQHFHFNMSLDGDPFVKKVVTSAQKNYVTIAK